MNLVELSRIFGVNARSLGRHRQLHLDPLLRRAVAAEIAVGEEVRAGDLLLEVRALLDRSRGILDQAETTKNLDIALRAVREARSCIETLARLTGQIDQGDTINVFMGPAWIETQTNILTALLPFPEAKSAVLAALIPSE